jgi:hypothetical protein
MAAEIARMAAAALAYRRRSGPRIEALQYIDQARLVRFDRHPGQPFLPLIPPSLQLAVTVRDHAPAQISTNRRKPDKASAPLHE